jgi:hypothetical protein
MIRRIKRYFAIRGFAQRLAPELARRWGAKKFYTLEQVTSAARAGGFAIDYIAYAHALFCSRSDFDGYYGPLRVSCTYDGLRAIVARRYFGGATDFDAASIVRATKRDDDGYFYESHEGDDPHG